jgi:hypothetical protein
LEGKFLEFKEISENANMLCHDMQPNRLLIWRGFINAKKWVLHRVNRVSKTEQHYPSRVSQNSNTDWQVDRVGPVSRVDQDTGVS